MLERLIGKQRHTIDEKNRTFIPAKFRAKLGDSIYITKSVTNKCLSLYSSAGFDKYVEDIVNKMERIEDADAISWLGANSEELQVDGQGRIALPQEFRQYAGLVKNVVSSGAFDHVELWDEKTFDDREAAIDITYVKAQLKKAEKSKNANPEGKG